MDSFTSEVWGYRITGGVLVEVEVWPSDLAAPTPGWLPGHEEPYVPQIDLHGLENPGERINAVLDQHGIEGVAIRRTIHWSYGDVTEVPRGRNLDLTTEEVRKRFSEWSTRPDEARARFDAWLAKRDAEPRAVHDG